MLESAANIVDERPDSAYVLLKQVDLNSFTREGDKALYALTHAKAKMYMGHSLVTDRVIPVAVEFFNAKGDTILYIESVIAQAYHLRSMELKDEAFSYIDSIAQTMPENIQKNLYQELLGFSFSDKDYVRSLDIIDRQIRLAEDDRERLNF